MNALGSSWELSDGVFRLIREYLTAILKMLPITLRMRFKLVLGVWTLANKLSDEEKLEMKRAIDLLTDVHFTRLDLAFDVFNNGVGMKYRIYRQTSHSANMAFIRHNGPKRWRRYITGLTVSEQQIRQYNKLVEQTKKNMPLPDGVEHWMRLELQLRGRKPTEWVEAC